jgi:hypothetical protein
MQSSPELRTTQLALYEAMSSGNAGSVEAFYSMQPEVAFVGTDASEFWTDSHQHNADVRRFFDGSEGHLTWSGGEIIAYAEKSLGWTFDRPRLRLPDGAEVKLRITLVWRREGERWLVAHSHASVGT